MSIERKIVSYLESFGNTRENDLINYGVQNLGQSLDKTKKIIDRLAVKGKLHRIVHNKLKPPEVYITLEEPFPQRQQWKERLQAKKLQEFLKKQLYSPTK